MLTDYLQQCKMVARRDFKAMQHNEVIRRPIPKPQQIRNAKIANINIELVSGLPVVDFLVRASNFFEPAVVIRNYYITKVIALKLKNMFLSDHNFFTLGYARRK